MSAPEPVERGKTFFDRDFKRETVRIMPGEYFVTNEDIGITTVLGSCVSACLLDRVAGVGGMNHFMLPHDGKAGSAPLDSIISTAARYGVQAMELTINELLRLGARRERLEAKVFGGAAVLDGFLYLNVGRQNATFVVEFLARESIALVAHDLEGTRPRKVYYQPKSGSAFVKYLGTDDRSAITNRERRYLEEVSRRPVRSEPELFS